MSLKAKIRNIAKQKNIPAQVILQNYMFERLLVRLSASENLLKSQALIKKSYRQKKSIAKQRRQSGSLGRLK